MTRYRAAIIGAGQISKIHAESLQREPDRAEIVAAVDQDEARVKAFCEQHHIPRWFTSTPEMLEATQPELVHIVTPPGSHCDLAIQSL